MSRTKVKTPKAVIFLIIAFLCPTEFSIFVADLRIPPHRLALLILLPLAFIQLLLNKGHKIRLFDVTMIVFNIWTVAIFMYHQGDRDGLVYGGSLALDGLGAYLVARVWIRDAAQFHAVLKLMSTAILVAALIALPETLFGHTYTHDILRSLTGYVHPTAVEHRLGLTRAYGTFDHPIHYGTFCAALFAQFWYASTSQKKRWKRAALLSGATFLGLSSAPLLCLGMQVAMLVWERLTRGIPSRTTLTLTIFVGLYIGASMVMNRSPINVIATGLTLDPWTGYYRLQIWQYGLQNVYAFPWTGIGLNDWERPWWMVSSTVDAFWLVITMREGLPGIFLILCSIALMARAVAKRGLNHPSAAVRRNARGWLMSLIALSLIGCTVHYWNVLYAYFFFFVGLSGWLADPLCAPARIPKGASRRAPVAAGRHYIPYPLPAAPAGGLGALPAPA
jgi:hypothetical protein